jgi:hypothetical protein
MPAIGKRIQFEDFVGESYPAKSPFVSAADAINLYPERLPIPGKSLFNYYNTPGTTLAANMPAGRMRCAYTALEQSASFSSSGQRTFFIGGEDDDARLYEIQEVTPGVYEAAEKAGFSSSGAEIFRPWQILSNGTELLIIGGTTNNGYVYELVGGGVTPITAPGWLGAASVAFLDGFGTAVKPESQEFFISGSGDFTAWDALDFALENDEPDQIVAVAEDHRRLWFFGVYRIEGYVDSGNVDFPLTRDQSAIIQTGTTAQQSIVSVDNTLFWLGQDARGGNVAYRMNGLTAERISGYAQESAWAEFGNTSDAVAFAYQENGHTFYQISFPTQGGPAFVYDIGEKQWHKRGLWNQLTAQFVSPLARYHAYNSVFGAHFVGGGDTSGNIYIQTQDAYTDNAAAIRRVRRSGYINDRNQRIFCGRFELQIETGTTQLLDGSGNPRQAQISMRFSDDNGHNWSNEQTVNCGALGQYAQSVYWLRQGSFIQRAYEVVYTEPTPVAITNAFLELSE